MVDRCVESLTLPAYLLACIPSCLGFIRARARKCQGPTVPGTKCEEPIVFVETIFIIFIWRRRIFEGLIVLENPRVVGTHLRSGENCKVSQ